MSARVENHLCDCGRPAVRRTAGGFACSRCLRLELAAKWKGNRKSKIKEGEGEAVTPFFVHLTGWTHSGT
jgi:hypothetical protein